MVYTWNRPFARSGHMVQNHTCWWASCAVGLPKQCNSYQYTWTCLWFGSPTAQLAHQHVWFFTMWPDRAKGLLFCAVCFDIPSAAIRKPFYHGKLICFFFCTEKAWKRSIPVRKGAKRFIRFIRCASYGNPEISTCNTGHFSFPNLTLSRLAATSIATNMGLFYTSDVRRQIADINYHELVLAFYHECCSLIGYATHYLFCCRYWVGRQCAVLNRMTAASSRLWKGFR